MANADVNEGSGPGPSIDEAESLRGIEQQRLRSLVEGDVETASRLHADAFQLITPVGALLSKEQYLGAIASGDLNYVVWEPGPIDVRVVDQMAALRYQSQLEIIGFGRKRPLRSVWHTDVYERRVGRWQVVFSHATEVAARQ